MRDTLKDIQINMIYYNASPCYNICSLLFSWHPVIRWLYFVLFSVEIFGGRTMGLAVMVKWLEHRTPMAVDHGSCQA